MSDPSGPVHIRNLGIYLASLLTVAGVSIAAVYGISAIFPSMFSKKLVIAILVLCSLILLVTAVSFASKEIVNAIDKNKKWTEIKLSILSLSLVLLLISIDYGYTTSNPVYIEPEFTPFVSLSILTILFITTDKAIKIALGTNSVLEIEETKPEYPMVSPECSNLIGNIIDDDKIDGMVNSYSEEERTFLTRKDLEDTIISTLRNVLEENNEQIENEIEKNKDDVIDEIDENRNEIANFVIKKHNLEERFDFMQSKTNIELLSKRAVYLGELKEYLNHEPIEYLTEISTIIEIEYSGQEPIKPEHISRKLKDAPLDERLRLAKFVDAQRKKEKKIVDNSETRTDWYFNRIDETEVLNN